MTRRISILKLGGSVLASARHVELAAAEIYRHLRRHEKVIAVVSALQDTTDRLQNDLERKGFSPASPHAATLLATGETVSAALLALTLEQAGVSAAVLMPHQLDLTAEGPPHDATLTHVSTPKLRTALHAYDVVIVPGFFALNPHGETCLLGRGGSDLTALFLRAALPDAHLRLLKDVDGVYEYDPRGAAKAPRRFARISWDDLVACAGPLVQEKTALQARTQAIPFEVAACFTDEATQVGASSAFDESAGLPPVRLKIGLLGHGTVGRAVAQRLEFEHERYDLRSILVRDAGSHAARCPQRAFTAAIEAFKQQEIDLFVDCGAANAPSAALLKHFLARGVPCVSANKQALAQHYAALKDHLRGTSTPLYHAASVGGGLPCLELVAHACAGARPVLIEGILNATTNYVLHRMSGGASAAEALRQAQQHGFAEADASADLDGWDAGAKLFLLAAAAAPQIDISAASVTCEPFEAVQRLNPNGSQVLKQIARADWRAGDAAPRLHVGFECVDDTHPFHGIVNEHNALRLVLENGKTLFITGKGAGAVPTLVSIAADLDDARRFVLKKRAGSSTPHSRPRGALRS